MMPRVSDPEDTAPFTHRPYGKDDDDNPFVSPSGPAAQPSGPSYVTPPPPPPTTVGPVPYGQVPYGQVPYGQVPYGQVPYGQVPYGQVPYGPAPGQQPWQAAWAPAYGAAYAGSIDHKGATASLVLGIVSIVSLVVGLACCFITFPGLFCAPFAWGIGAKAKREIEASPGTYGNLSAAVTGMWMGIVMTFVGFLVIAGVIALFAWVGLSDPTLV
jgi:hypothetical protein